MPEVQLKNAKQPQHCELAVCCWLHCLALFGTAHWALAGSQVQCQPALDVSMQPACEG
jgi:hypothetical protein